MTAALVVLVAALTLAVVLGQLTMDALQGRPGATLPRLRPLRMPAQRYRSPTTGTRSEQRR